MIALKKYQHYIIKALSVMGSNASVSASNLLIALLLTKSHGLGYYGEFVFYQALFLTYSLFFKPVTWQAIIKFAPEVNIYQLVRYSIKLEFVFMLIGFLASTVVISIFFYDFISVEIVFVCILFIFINNGTIIGYTRAIGSFHYVSALIFICSVLKVIIAFTFDTSAIRLLLYIIFAEALMWILFICFKLVNFYKSHEMLIHDGNFFYRFSLWGMAHEILDLPVRYLDKIIIANVLGTHSVGVLDVIKRASQIVSQFTVPLSALVLPKYSKLVFDGNYRKVKEISKIITISFFVLSVILLGCFYISFDFLNENLFSNELRDYKSFAIGFLCVQLFSMTFVWVHPLSLIVVKMGVIAKIICFANFLYLGVLYFTVDSMHLPAVLLAFTFQVLIVVFAKMFLIARNLK